MDHPEKQQAIRLINFSVNDVNMHIGMPASDEQKSKMDVSIEFGLGFDEQQSNNYSVTFKVELKRQNNSFSLNLQATALFESQEPIDENFKKSGFVKTNSPAIAFPFIRSFINTLTTNAGISPVILPAFNFSDSTKK
ncbi:MAG TPA: protein-export chaperone SecB [Prolixibacteraceae bacterium]|nr:protein-export chaperone SecB [Prolixibacteraceae bacterium]